MSLLFKMLSRLVIAFLPRSKCLVISWLQTGSAVIWEPKKRRSVTVSTFAPFVCHEVMGLDAMILVFWMLSFQPAFTFSSFSSSSLSAIGVASFAYLRLLIFLSAILIPAWDSSSFAFHAMCSAYKLNKQCDNITVLMCSFPSFEPGRCSMTASKGCFLTCKVSQEASKVMWYSYLFKHFPQFVWSTQRLSPSQWSRSRLFFFFKFPCFFYDPADAGNLISGSSAFSKSSLYIWKFPVHVPLKPSLKDFEHYLASMWSELRLWHLVPSVHGK